MAKESAHRTWKQKTNKRESSNSSLKTPQSSAKRDVRLWLKKVALSRARREVQGKKRRLESFLDINLTLHSEARKYRKEGRKDSSSVSRRRLLSFGFRNRAVYSITREPDGGDGDGGDGKEERGGGLGSRVVSKRWKI
uniref:Uncharacterized protein n=1 Tax=Vespula pensylvanica TaxID=30213 RepID=A0A834P1D6_VESPE|nr:hypothetical protein H0235_009162 [Vespula pensylvanica]